MHLEITLEFTNFYILMSVDMCLASYLLNQLNELFSDLFNLDLLCTLFSGFSPTKDWTK